MSLISWPCFIRKKKICDERQVGIPGHGWQHEATEAVAHLLATTGTRRTSLDPCQGSPSRVIESSSFRVLVLRRLPQLPVCFVAPPSSLRTGWGVGSPGFCPRVSCGSRLQGKVVGARVSTNVMLRDLDLLPQDHPDTRRWEVVADGFPLHHGAQLAIDTTMVSPLLRDGVPRPRSMTVDGVLGNSQETEGETLPVWESTGGAGV